MSRAPTTLHETSWCTSPANDMLKAKGITLIAASEPAYFLRHVANTLYELHREALANGAPRSSVTERMRKFGLDPSAL